MDELKADADMTAILDDLPKGERCPQCRQRIPSRLISPSKMQWKARLVMVAAILVAVFLLTTARVKVREPRSEVEELEQVAAE